MNETTPHRVVHVDLEGGVGSLIEEPDDGRDVFAVFWRSGLPLGRACLTRAQRTCAASLADLVAGVVAPSIAARLAPEDLDVSTAMALEHPLASLDRFDEPPAPRDRVSVVICTRDRAAELRRCLESLEYASGDAEVLVVDNAPSSGDTRKTVEDFPGVKYVLEGRPGLSRARNSGIRASSGDVVAFVDDDVTVHPAWLRRLVAALDHPQTMAAAGLVLPAELETPPQAAAELLRGWLGGGYLPARLGPSFLEHARRRPVPVWQIGAGANMAIRKDAFRRIGLFDERLGAGRAGCSEDSEFWYRLLAAGLEFRYEPGAVVFHTHRREASAFYRQAHDYMRGHLAGLFVQFARHRHLGNLRQAFFTLPRYYLGRLVRDVRPSRPELVRGCALAEIRGLLRGLLTLPLAITAPPLGRQRLRQLLHENPYPHPFTEGFFYREKMRAIHRVAPYRPVLDALEVGGGRSGLTALLYPQARVTNVDRNPALADAPPNLDPRVRFVHGDATKLPFTDASFDLVTMFDLLEHVEDDGAAVREGLRVLRPDGRLLITSPSEHWRFPYHRAMRGICPSEAEMLAEWAHVRRGYSVDDLRRLLALEPEATASFISPVTVVCHDLAFSKLRGRIRRGLCALIAPVTWTAYWLHRSAARGTETASSWRKPG